MKEDEKLLLEERKVKALESIAKSFDFIAMWFEEIDKEDWGARIEYYLNEFYIMRKMEMEKHVDINKDEENNDE